jgi:hypothetical protein
MDCLSPILRKYKNLTNKLKIKTGYNIVMKTITKKYKRKYQKKRKTTKKLLRKNKYFLKGGEVEQKKEGNEKKEGDEKKEGEENKEGEEKKEGEENKEGEEKKEGDEGDEVEVSEEEGKNAAKEWIRKDSVMGPIYYSIWTARGEPIFVWTMNGIEFFKGDFKKKLMSTFLTLNPTAAVATAAFDTGISLIQENSDKIQQVRSILNTPLPAIPTPTINVNPPTISVKGGRKRKYSRRIRK